MPFPRTPVRVTEHGASLEEAWEQLRGGIPASEPQAPHHQSPMTPAPIRHPGHSLPSQPLASCRKAYTQSTFLPAKLMMANAFPCSEFPRACTFSHGLGLSINSTSFHSIKKSELQPWEEGRRTGGSQLIPRGTAASSKEPLS